MKKIRGINIKHKKMNRTNNILFILLCIIVLSFTVGYSSLNKELKISAEASYRPEVDLRVTGIR